jgi:hypothetical protein
MMNNKIWLSNVSIEEAGEITEAFSGVSVGLPQAVDGMSVRALCSESIAGLYATEERARELIHERGK